jgi:hypothetical protein
VTLAPLPIPLEQLVIVEITDGIADTSLVHLPAERCNKGGFRFDSYDFPPSTWPAACGRGSGSVYVRAGCLADARICPECEMCV